MSKPDPGRRPWKTRALRCALVLAALLTGVATVPRWWCGRDAGRWYAGDAATQERLARGIEHWLAADLSRTNFATGSSQFSGEWLFGTYLMAGLGFGQTALEHPEWKARHLSLMDRCIARILSDPVRTFDRESWKDDPIESLDGDSDHAAYLGYFNLLLSFHRLLQPDSKHAALNDRITAALARRLRASPILLLHTYPGEVYPVDNCAVIASIGLHDRVTRGTNGLLVAAWMARCRTNYLDARTGLLIQAVDEKTGEARDVARGSGTTLGLYFLSFIERPMAEAMFQAVKRDLARSVAGFGLVREYAAGESGHGDIDSGPVLLGYGVSPTGFSLAGCRMFGDVNYFTKLYRIVHLFGAPRSRGDAMHFTTGGPIGDSILFAMLTARQLPSELAP